MQSHIQRAINSTIATPDYKPPLPNLDADVWNKILDWRTHRLSNDCLEWLGDALMYAAISVELYRQVPKGTPHMFTSIRAPIVTNQTFALLTNKLNLSGVLIQANPRPEPFSPFAKCFADLFEVLPAEIYMRGGFDVLRDWVAKVFGPLITAAVSAYEERKSAAWNQKRKRAEDQDQDDTIHSYKGIVMSRKRQKISYARDSAEYPVAKERPSGTSARESFPNPALRDLPALVVRSPPKRPTMSTPLLAKDAPRKLNAAEKDLFTLSEISGNTASSSREPKHSVREQASRQSTYGYRSSFVTHSTAWAHVLSGASNEGTSRLHAILASPSRYTTAAPSEPACGPGSSRFDPIIIDDEEGEENANATHGSSRQVIELLDDEDSESDQRHVENVIDIIDSELEEI